MGDKVRGLMERYWKTMGNKVPGPSGTNKMIMKDNGDKFLEPMERYWNTMGNKVAEAMEDNERQWKPNFRNQRKDTGR